MKKILSYLFYLYFGLIYIVFCIILSIPIFLFVRGKRKNLVAKRIKTFWATYMSKAIGIKTKVTFLSNLNSNDNYIICANHKSYLDIVLMYLVIDIDFAFLGKSELLKWPVINIFFKRGVDIPVYRDSKTRAAECLIVTILVRFGLLNKKDPEIDCLLRKPIINWANHITGFLKATDNVWERGTPLI